MSNADNQQPHPWRRPLLTLEFSALAVLLGSMLWLSDQAKQGVAISTGWLLVPTLASLGVFGSFIGLMYLRWVAASSAQNRSRQKLIFAILALTLLGVWVYGIANTWLSLNNH